MSDNNNVSGPKYPGHVIMYANDTVYDESSGEYKQNNINSITAIAFKGEDSYKLAYRVVYGKYPDMITDKNVFDNFKKEMNKAADRYNDDDEGKVTTVAYGDVLVLSQYAKTKAEVQKEIDAVKKAEDAKKEKANNLQVRKENLEESELKTEKTNNTIKAAGAGAAVGAAAVVTVGAAATKALIATKFITSATTVAAALGPWGLVALAAVGLAVGGYLAWQTIAKPKNQNLEDAHLIRQEEAALEEDNK